MINLEDIANIAENLEKKIEYYFNNKKILINALSHSSYVNENRDYRLTSNERLEFLGDSVLNLSISEHIYFNHTNLTEGEMTKIRAQIVCEASLLVCSNKIQLGECLLLGRGEELTGGRTRVSILSDAFEALIGAIYMDSGIESAKKFIMNQMKDIINKSLSGSITMDYKTELQELVQRGGESKIVYEIVEQKGPDHDKIFVSRVKILEAIVGIGEGKSKKEAEQMAAKAALVKLRNG